MALPHRLTLSWTSPSTACSQRVPSAGRRRTGAPGLANLPVPSTDVTVVIPAPHPVVTGSLSSLAMPSVSSLTPQTGNLMGPPMHVTPLSSSAAATWRAGASAAEPLVAAVSAAQVPVKLTDSSSSAESAGALPRQQQTGQQAQYHRPVKSSHANDLPLAAWCCATGST